MTATPSKAPIFCSLNSRFARRRPRTSLRTFTCIMQLRFRYTGGNKGMPRTFRLRAWPRRLREERNVLARDHDRLPVAVPDRNRLGGIAVLGEIQPAADQPEPIFC